MRKAVNCMGKVCNKTSKVGHQPAAITHPEQNPCRHQSCIFLSCPAPRYSAGRLERERESHMGLHVRAPAGDRPPTVLPPSLSSQNLRGPS